MLLMTSRNHDPGRALCKGGEEVGCVIFQLQHTRNSKSSSLLELIPDCILLHDTAINSLLAKMGHSACCFWADQRIGRLCWGDVNR